MTNSRLALEVNGLSVAYEEKTVLQDIQWSVKQGALAAVIGPNGGGKSTLLKSLVGLIKPTSGEVNLLGTSPRLARSQVAYLPQSEEVDWLFPISAVEVVLQGRLVHRHWWQRSSRQDRGFAHDCLARVGMADYARRPIGALSGGQKQKIFLARALAQQANLIVLDEPGTGLDAAAQHGLLEIFQELAAEGRTVVITTHDLNCLAEHFHEVLGLNGTVVVRGKPREVLNAQVLTSLFAKHFPMMKPTGEVALHDF